MSGFEKSTATLRFFGDDLDPDVITERLGCPPTRCARKGDIKIGRVTGRERAAVTGSWMLKAQEKTPADLDLQIKELLGQLTDDQRVWRELTETYSGDMFCGLFMSTGNDGLILSPATMLALGNRNLQFGLDVYNKVED